MPITIPSTVTDKQFNQIRISYSGTESDVLPILLIDQITCSVLSDTTLSSIVSAMDTEVLANNPSGTIVRTVSFEFTPASNQTHTQIRP